MSVSLWHILQIQTDRLRTIDRYSRYIQYIYYYIYIFLLLLNCLKLRTSLSCRNAYDHIGHRHQHVMTFCLVIILFKGNKPKKISKETPYHIIPYHTIPYHTIGNSTPQNIKIKIRSHYQSLNSGQLLQLKASQWYLLTVSFFVIIPFNTNFKSSGEAGGAEVLILAQAYWILPLN